MENQRLFLFIALSIVVMLLYDAWQVKYGPKPTPVATLEQPQATGGVPVEPSNMPRTTTEELPSQVPQTASEGSAQAATVLKSGTRVRVITDVLDVEIDTMGGDLRYGALLKYPVEVIHPDKPVVLFNDKMPQLMVAQAGLLGSDKQSADINTLYSAPQELYSLPEGSDAVVVPLTWQSESGVKVLKTYTFHRSSYLVDVDFEVSNGSATPWAGRMYRQLQRTKSEQSSAFIYTYTGGIVSTPENVYEKVDFDDMSSWKPEQTYNTGGWVAMIQHYFFGAWIPVQTEQNHFYTKALEKIDGSRYIIGLTSTEKQVAPGQNGQFTSKLYLGPKEQKIIETIAPNLELTVDYGVLTLLAKPVYWLLDTIHTWVGNWGWAIIFVTIIIKAIFYKLSEKAYKSMANMRKFQPKIQALRERYGNDKQRMSQAMMDLYKKEKINPLGGCLPMLVQIPVFIALYWVLLESVELRQADFIFWLNDLSSKDPFYVLPILMGVSMYIQQKLNPAPMDPVQQKVLMALPWIFTLFFAFFPSGLVLYWVVNNVLSIIQQWVITRKIEAQA
ncbi:MAG: membrane protein insertase YidC [Gammaproteobacteria bacterium]|nr:membrane protein insertase YidC [Gammaproteobacteria bacterium]MDH5799575.1 membrane protein insertase YidC [Gammaproteobacteria bacterium]